MTWRNFKNIFRPEMLKIHPYSILTGDTMVGFVIYWLLRQTSIFKVRNSITDSALILTKLRRDSVFAAMSSKMNVVIWKEFSFNRKSRGSSSFLQREEAKKILGNELVQGCRKWVGSVGARPPRFWQNRRRRRAAVARRIITYLPRFSDFTTPLVTGSNAPYYLLT